MDPLQRWQHEREHERELERAGIDHATGLRRGRPIAVPDSTPASSPWPPTELQRLLDEATALMLPGAPDPVTGSFASEAHRQQFDELIAKVDGCAVQELPWRR